MGWPLLSQDYLDNAGLGLSHQTRCEATAGPCLVGRLSKMWVGESLLSVPRRPGLPTFDRNNRILGHGQHQEPKLQGSASY